MKQKIKSLVNGYIAKHTHIEKVIVHGINLQGKEVHEELELVEMDRIARLLWNIFKRPKWKTVTINRFKKLI